jgi:anti-anti-sigma factor
MPTAGSRKRKKPAPAGTDYRIAFDEPMTGPGVARFEEKLLLEIDRIDSSSVILDLRAVSRIDSKGLSLCVGLYRELEKKKASLSIEASAEIAETFRMVKLDRVMSIKEVAR